MIIQGNDCQIRGLFIAFVKTNCCSASFTDNTSKWLAFVVSSKNQHSSYRKEEKFSSSWRGVRVLRVRVTRVLLK